MCTFPFASNNSFISLSCRSGGSRHTQTRTQRSAEPCKSSESTNQLLITSAPIFPPFVQHSRRTHFFFFFSAQMMLCDEEGGREGRRGGKPCSAEEQKFEELKLGGERNRDFSFPSSPPPLKLRGGLLPRDTAGV